MPRRILVLRADRLKRSFSLFFTIGFDADWLVASVLNVQEHERSIAGARLHPENSVRSFAIPSAPLQQTASSLSYRVNFPIPAKYIWRITTHHARPREIGQRPYTLQCRV